MDDEQSAPIFLTLQEVLEIHRDQIARYGGGEGLLNQGHLESALAQPAATFDGRFPHPDIYEMAAVDLVHLARNHAFVDGNKRVATVAAIVFLAMNGHEFDADPAELETVVLAVAQGEMGRETAARFFRDNCV